VRSKRKLFDYLMDTDNSIQFLYLKFV